MVQKFFTTALLVVANLAVLPAQQSSGPIDTLVTPPPPVAPAKKTPTFTTSADVYYRYDFGQTPDNDFTSFTHSHNSFELGMISVKAEHQAGKVGMVADIGFGKRAEEFSYADDQTRFIIKQLNLSYTFKYDIKVTAGSWATHVGYELVDAYANRNYSMSYMFSYGPFFHTGLKAEKSFGRTGFMLGIANPTDLKSTDFKRKYLIGQISSATGDEALKAWLNVQGGQPNDSIRMNQVDLVLSATLSPKFSLGFNTTMSHFQRKTSESDFGKADGWWGAAVYANADPLDWLGLTLRAEYFDDAKQLNVFSAIPGGGHLLATTLSLNLKAEDLILIPEIRFEKASSDLFLKDGGKPASSSIAVLLAAVYKI